MGVLRDLMYAGAGVLTSPVWGYRLLSTGKWRTDWAGRFGRTSVEPARAGQKTLLIHAVSVGEVNAIRRLVDRLSAMHGDALRVVISVTTDTGTARARALFEPDHAVVRYPLDFTRSVRRFLDAVKPDAVALVELEVWPTFVEECAKRGVPVAVINGRLSARSYGRYSKVRGLVAPMFGRLTHAAVQDDAYAQRFVGLGVPSDRVTVTGTMKWDTAVIADDAPGSAALRAALGIDAARPLLVCGSTGPGEERMLIEALAGVDAQVLIAPRKPERFDEAAREMAEASGGAVVRRTERVDGGETAGGGGGADMGDAASGGVFLLDTLGELAKAYALADVVVVGRTFAAMGGSDMIEPIGLGKPVIVGPHTENFASQMAALRAGDGIAEVGGIGEVAGRVRALMGTAAGRELAERGRAVIRAQQGATDRHAALMQELLGL